MYKPLENFHIRILHPAAKLKNVRFLAQSMVNVEPLSIETIARQFNSAVSKSVWLIHMAAASDIAVSIDLFQKLS